MSCRFPFCVIENISGMAYADYMKTEIFEPLGMKTAVVDREGLPIPNRVKGYALEDGAPVEIEKSYNWILGAADIVGTVEDVYCLNKAIKDRLLLSEESWQMILTPSNVNDKGMGCTVSCWHGKQVIWDFALCTSNCRRRISISFSSPTAVLVMPGMILRK